ncbi:MAG: hypothetical protein QOD78_2241 [Chloroflexota bacterium]|nr:hypothetical protein [Chloroflexota bacterium]
MHRGTRRWFDGPGCATIDRVSAETTPVKFHADRAAATLAIEWADGHATTYAFEPLRWLCPCAYCRGEAGMPGWLDSAPSLTPEQIQLTDLHLVGNYAISPHWADGHKTGYYPFTLLRDRCPCPDCTARRAGGGVPSAPAAAGTHEEHR